MRKIHGHQLPPTAKIASPILLYGRDRHLLETRRLVLTSAGYEVCTTDEVSKIAPALEATRFGLLILCHSASSEDCGHVEALTSTRWPQLKVLFLTAGQAGCHSELLSGVFDITGGPGKLISTVGGIVKAVGD